MILVAGEALVDVLVRSGRPEVAVPGGGPFNTARAIARLGVPVAWAGVLSSDAHGRALDAALRTDGVSLDLAQRTDLPTTRALAEVDEHGEARYRFEVDGTSAPALDGELLVRSLPSDLAAVHVGTLGLVLEPMGTAIEALVAALPDDVLLMVDPNCRPSLIADPASYRERVARILARADVVKLSTQDLAFLRPDATLDEGVAWIEARGPRIVVLTDAERPITVRARGETVAVPVPGVQVVDTVGAGDALGGALLADLVRRRLGRPLLVDARPIIEAVGFAARAASQACGRAGADPPTLADLGGWPSA